MKETNNKNVVVHTMLHTTHDYNIEVRGLSPKGDTRISLENRKTLGIFKGEDTYTFLPYESEEPISLQEMVEMAGKPNVEIDFMSIGGFEDLEFSIICAIAAQRMECWIIPVFEHSERWHYDKDWDCADKWMLVLYCEMTGKYMRFGPIASRDLFQYFYKSRPVAPPVHILD